MYIEAKGGGLSGPARIGRVVYSKSGKSVYYRGRVFETLKGRGYKANYFDCKSGEHYWISGCKKKGGDRLYPGFIEIDDDAREEYWTVIRCLPGMKHTKRIRCTGKHGGRR